MPLIPFLHIKKGKIKKTSIGIIRKAVKIAQNAGLLCVYGENVNNQEINTIFFHNCKKKTIITKRNLTIKTSINIYNERKCVFYNIKIPNNFNKIDF